MQHGSRVGSPGRRRWPTTSAGGRRAHPLRRVPGPPVAVPVQRRCRSPTTPSTTATTSASSRPTRSVFLFQGMRVNPNNDMIGGYAGVMHRRPPVHGALQAPVAPRLRHPHRSVPLRLRRAVPRDPPHARREPVGPRASTCAGWPPRRAFEEAHHLATSRGRRTTDQTRYTQSGTAAGWIELDGRRFEVTPGALVGQPRPLVGPVLRAARWPRTASGCVRPERAARGPAGAAVLDGVLVARR